MAIQIAVVSLALRLLKQEIAYLLIWGRKYKKYIFHQVLNDSHSENKMHQPSNKKENPTASYLHKYMRK